MGKTNRHQQTRKQIVQTAEQNASRELSYLLHYCKKQEAKRLKEFEAMLETDRQLELVSLEG